jgi:glycine/D-amino acid oxidase-like deaminating enzyme
VRVIVVGAGIIGQLTAMECVRLGVQVDLVDQGGVPDAAATSNDTQRVVRALHRADAPLTFAAARLHGAWGAVERRLGEHFYRRMGVLTVGTAAEVAASLDIVVEAGIAAQALSADELAAGYPRLRFAAGLEAVYEASAGVVLADRALTALAAWLRDQPSVTLHPGRRVVGLEDKGTVRFADGADLVGDSVVVAAGPWSRELLPASLAADLTLYRQTMLSYEPIPHRKSWACAPPMLGLGEPRDAWLIPPVADTLVRLSAASASRPVAEMTDRVAPAEYREHLMDRFSTLLTGFDPDAVVEAKDGYYLSSSSTEGPLLASVGDGSVWAYAACGGMSFKFAPVIARALADRAAGRTVRPTGLPWVDEPKQAIQEEIVR